MNLEDKRRRIDAIDDAITDLLNDRAAIAKEIALIKMSGGLPIVDVQREVQVLRRLVGRNTGEFKNTTLVSIFRRILDESRRIQLNARGELTARGAVK